MADLILAEQRQGTCFPTTVYLISGGKSSTLATWYHRNKHPEREYLYYFNDTLVEHESTYRFLIESLYFLEGLKITKKVADLVRSIPRIKPGIDIQERTKHLDKLFEIVCNDTGLIRSRYVDPWTCFDVQRFIGNTRVDTCSRVLKREPRKLFTDSLHNIEICFGLNWTEIHRYEKTLTYEPNAIAPLATDLVDKDKLWIEFHACSGIKEAEAYGIGLSNDNCAGGCVKAGQAQWKKVWLYRRDVYLWNEQCMDEVMNKNPNLRPFLRMTINGELKYLTLKEYRENFLELDAKVDEEDFGGCGCALAA